ncbi:MAG: aminopeptidase P family protein [Rhodobacteraceae bacterium]|nr:aminopeptidase P family protein [Paracoccaceae bacterium]
MSERAVKRLGKIRASMKATNTQLVALGPGAHMQWVLGFHTHADERPCLLLIGEEREAFLMPALNAEDTRQRCSITCHEWADDEGPIKALLAALDDVGAGNARNIVLDETMRADFAMLLIDHLPGANRSFTENTVGALRMRKDEMEYASLKENASIADQAMFAGIAAIKPGMRELEVAAIIERKFKDQNTAMKFTIVGAGPNGALPHHHTGSSILEMGNGIVIDIGGQKGEYSSDITRFAVLGEPSEEMVKVHGIVNEAVNSAMEITRPGVRAREVDRAARGVITKAGYGEFFVHRTGHGLGIEVHEPPYITASSETILETGMVFSIEPGIYLPGKFGVRLEEIVILREDGPEILSSLSRDIIRV